MDAQTALTIAALIGTIVGLTKFLVPDGAHQNDGVRLYAALLGTILTCLYAAHANAHFDVSTLGSWSALLDPAAQGLLLGASATVAVKGYHLAIDKAGTVALVPDAPESPVSPVIVPAPVPSPAPPVAPTTP